MEGLDQIVCVAFVWSCCCGYQFPIASSLPATVTCSGEKYLPPSRDATRKLRHLQPATINFFNSRFQMSTHRPTHYFFEAAWLYASACCNDATVKCNHWTEDVWRLAVALIHTNDRTDLNDSVVYYEVRRVVLTDISDSVQTNKHIRSNNFMCLVSEMRKILDFCRSKMWRPFAYCN
jgi:hypothetical protein